MCHYFGTRSQKQEAKSKKQNHFKINLWRDSPSRSEAPSWRRFCWCGSKRGGRRCSRWSSPCLRIFRSFLFRFSCFLVLLKSNYWRYSMFGLHFVFFTWKLRLFLDDDSFFGTTTAFFGRRQLFLDDDRCFWTTTAFFGRRRNFFWTSTAFLFWTKTAFLDDDSFFGHKVLGVLFFVPKKREKASR